MKSQLKLNVKCCDKECDQINNICTPIKRNSPILEHSRNTSPIWKNQNVKRINNIYYQLKNNYCLNNIEIDNYISDFKQHMQKYIKILNDKNQYSIENIESYLRFYSLFDKTIATYVKKIIIDKKEFIV